MNDELDRAVEAAVTQTYAAHARTIGHPTGRLDDVLRRVARRRNRRRAMAGVASVALVGAGIVGIVAAGQMGSEAPALGAPGGPATSTPGAGGSWFVCSGAIERDGATVYDWCELETPYANPAWSCSGEVVDPALDGDDRPRFQNCTAVGEAYSAPDVCVPITVVPVGTVPVVTVPGAPQGTAPPTTWVEELCANGQPLPTYVVGTTPALSVPCAPIAAAGSVVCEPVYVDDVPPATAPPTVHPTPPMTTPLSTPQPSVAPTTAVAANTPVQPARVLALGDSVMMGAADVLGTRGWAVVAEQSLQMVDAAPILWDLVAEGAIRPGTETVILHVGTNGAFSAETLDAVLAPLADVPNVLLYTIRADRTWTEPNNELLRAADSRPNVVLIDWELRSTECTDDCFAGDGIHLNENGKQFYADLARDWTGM